MKPWYVESNCWKVRWRSACIRPHPDHIAEFTDVSYRGLERLNLVHIVVYPEIYYRGSLSSMAMGIIVKLAASLGSSSLRYS